MTKKVVRACPMCGSSDVSGLKHLKHWLKRFGPLMGVYTCQECGYEGFPFVLDSVEEYKKFIKLKQKEKRNTKSNCLKNR